ncbi:MAG: DUF3616 domain-containing protein [Gammaproteobacteria bacterium]|uniref:DUF3616 domain-containing protein n=1 Tax=Rhodoferax sp. TaxID=50421 RepID=UPI0017906B94|nr:DUF3616 domain-containing protein [Rhodoferax sp.]MBU3899066.1 DUF3616 domain-containing protein [Gammaproteobacteria bacterium]MBA3057634.1 DUF3616 domain-containing protein [Rhodoferax sp.]MBU3997626.1 DUF3616 domain-containing protein [Gammaproteobacteria bacterium]MBU4018510.1 DUF3616 domain-containing protein [Gammaproteobacteria bacterium]MBU4080522.1 DUF3616 domain-containing protein [Gammaproteobacteria bacterium]
MALNNILMFLALTGLYEPSAVQQLPDGSFLVVEDEKEQPFSLLSIQPDGKVSSKALKAGLFQWGDTFWKLDDLEALALDRSGYVYASTSHSRNSGGGEKKHRDKLVRFKVEGSRVVEPQVVTGLKSALAAKHPVLAAAAALRDVKTDGGFNIEAIEISPDQRLLIGFRSPLLGHRAIIASVENPGALFDNGAAPQVAPTLITLDLGGNGIRGMAYIAALGAYLIISGPVGSQAANFGLWFWSGAPAAPARRVTVPGLPGFEHAEGVSAALIDGQPRILIVSDDGSRQEGRYARYLLLDPAQLQIAP